MTNKEKFKEVFGLEIDDTSDCGFFDCTDRECKDCPVKDIKDWWNSEYKEPTTENCESCSNYGSHNEVCNYCYKCSLWTEKEPTTKNNLGVDCISRQSVTLNNPCKDCSEKTWCGGFACKEAREYLDSKNKVNRSEQ